MTVTEDCGDCGVAAAICTKATGWADGTVTVIAAEADLLVSATLIAVTVYVPAATGAV